MKLIKIFLLVLGLPVWLPLACISDTVAYRMMAVINDVMTGKTPSHKNEDDFKR